jgi:hypothetical protein
VTLVYVLDVTEIVAFILNILCESTPIGVAIEYSAFVQQAPLIDNSAVIDDIYQRFQFIDT